MPLRNANLENLNDAELDELVKQKMTVQAGPQIRQAPLPQTDEEISDQELDQMVFDKLSQAQDPNAEIEKMQPARVDPETEASLGFMTRGQYALEPLESNRRALLEEKFGKENVFQDKSGEVYLQQGNRIMPVNVEGLSTADFADVLGATPEMVGAGAGFAVGFGPGSIPGAMIGGAAGSAFRQAMSADLGTPQVATPGERIAEVGLSAVFSGAGAGAGKLIKMGAKKASPLIKKAFRRFKISGEGKQMFRIAKKEGIPSPTVGQMAGGRDLDLEKMLGDRPLFGRGIRKQVDAQAKAIKKNLADLAGEFVDTESGRDMAGIKIKEIASGSIKAMKKQSGELFDKVAAEGRDVMIESKPFKHELLKNFKGLGLFNNKGELLEHTSRTGLTEDQFKRIQGIFKKVLTDVDNSAGVVGTDGLIGGSSSIGHIDATTLNTMRKYLDANIKEGGKQGFDDVLLIKLKESFLDVTEELLGSKDAALKGEFRQARALWARQIKINKIFEKGGLKGLGIKDLSDEKVIKKIFASKNGVKQLKELIGDEATDKAGISYVNDILIEKLGKEDKITAAAAINTVKRSKEAIIEAIGLKKYNKLRNNLFFLDKIGSPYNPSMTHASKLMQDISPSGLFTGAAQTVERKGRQISRNVARDIVRKTRQLPKVGAKAAAALGDPTQREAAFLMRGPQAKMIADKQRKTKRQVATEK